MQPKELTKWNERHFQICLALISRPTFNPYGSTPACQLWRHHQQGRQNGLASTRTRGRTNHEIRKIRPKDLKIIHVIKNRKIILLNPLLREL